MTKNTSLSKGDQVAWRKDGTTTSGKIVERIEKPRIKNGKGIDASEAAPQYRIRNEKTGRVEVQAPKDLKRSKDN